MSLLEFRRWRATREGAIEYAWFREEWALAQAEAVAQQDVAWSNQAPPGKHRAVHRKGQVA